MHSKRRFDLSILRTCLSTSGVAVLLAACISPGGTDQAGAGKEPAMARPSTAREECIFGSVVNDWTPIDDERLLIYGPGRRQAYIARLMSPTPDLRSAINMAIVDGDRDGRICGFSSDSVVFENAAMPIRNNIRSLWRIEKAEADEILKSLDAQHKNKIRKKPKVKP